MKVFRNTKKKQIETKHMLLILSITCVVGIFAGLIFNIKGGPLNTIAGYIFIPMQQGINNTGAWIFDFANDFRTLSDVLEENKELKAKIEELEKQISDNKQDQYELENLRELFELDEKYPQYNFKKHKGYGTKLHYEKIKEYGISNAHRRTFLKNLNEHE